MNIEERVEKQIRELLEERKFPEHGTVMIAPHEVLVSLSREVGLDRNLVEKIAFRCGAVPERYARNLITFSPEEQAKLFNSTVALVGLGGLGGHLLESLARAGVGRINACDGDSFEPSNLNRQLLATENSLSLKKSEAAYELVRCINPAVFLDVRSRYLEANEFSDFISDADVVVDCLGGLSQRAQLRNAAAEAGIPLVTASVAGWAGIVATVYPGDSSPAELLGDDEGLEEVLGTPVSAISTAVGLQSAEILKILSGKDVSLSGKAMLFDLNKMYFDLVSL